MEKSMLKILLQDGDCCYEETGDNEFKDSLSIRVKPNARSKDIREFWYKLLDLLFEDVTIGIHVGYQKTLQEFEKGFRTTTKAKTKIAHIGEFIMLAPVKLINSEYFFVKTVTDLRIGNGSEHFFELLDAINVEVDTVPNEYERIKSKNLLEFGTKKMCEAEDVPFNPLVRVGLNFTPESLHEIEFKYLILPNTTKDLF